MPVSMSEVRTAAMLAWDGYLKSLERIRIMKTDITDITRAQLEKLTSIVTETLFINDITQTSKLGSILACVQCVELVIQDSELSEADTQSLVTAMRDRVKVVNLCHTTLDIEEFTKYDGQGRCRHVCVWEDTGHLDRLKKWGPRAGWAVTRDEEPLLISCPNSVQNLNLIYG